MDYKNDVNPYNTLACYLVIFEVRGGNSDYSFDYEFLKPLLVFDLGLY